MQRPNLDPKKRQVTEKTRPRALPKSWQKRRGSQRNGRGLSVANRPKTGVWMAVGLIWFDDACPVSYFDPWHKLCLTFSQARLVRNSAGAIEAVDSSKCASTVVAEWNLNHLEISSFFRETKMQNMDPTEFEACFPDVRIPMFHQAGRIPVLRAASRPPRPGPEGSSCLSAGGAPRLVHAVVETICHCVAGIQPTVRDPPRDTGWRRQAVWKFRTNSM